MASTNRPKLPEKWKAFIDSALKAEQEVSRYGLVYDADEVFSYILAKAKGRRAARPKTRKL
jgi:hypothetical protein